MQQKLKSVFRRSSKSRSSSGSHEKLGSSSHYSEANSTRANRQRVSSDGRGRTSVDSSATGSVYTGRSRPVSSIYDDTRRAQAPTGQTATSDFASPADPNGGAIATDYKAYLPALSPVNDDHGDEYIALGGDRQHERNVADRNIAPYSTSIDGGHRNAASGAHSGSAVSSPSECQCCYYLQETCTYQFLCIPEYLNPNIDSSCSRFNTPFGSSTFTQTIRRHSVFRSHPELRSDWRSCEER
jgi:hypothetical protein